MRRLVEGRDHIVPVYREANHENHDGVFGHQGSIPWGVLSIW